MSSVIIECSATENEPDLGSVVGLTDAGDPDALPEPLPAALVERYEYDPYGQTYIDTWDASAGGGAGGWVRRAATAGSFYGNPFAWTGQRFDAAVGLYHFYARSYAPILGRWLQRDPLGYVDGVNLYEYVASVPLGSVDPFGLNSAPVVPATVGAYVAKIVGAATVALLAAIQSGDQEVVQAAIYALQSALREAGEVLSGFTATAESNRTKTPDTVPPRGVPGPMGGTCTMIFGT